MIPNLDVIHQYAPNVAPQTIAAIIRVESGGNPFAVGINGRAHRRIRPKSAQEAASEARYFIAKGYSVDLGLMQINSHNLRGLGLTVEQAFDPGANIQAGAKILTRGYCGAIRRFGPGQDALRAALSAYNTGNYERGFKNGYVAKYFPPAGVRCSITPIVVKAPSPHSTIVAGGIRHGFSTHAISNPYIAELTVYKRVEPPKSIVLRDSSRAEAAASNVSIADIPTEVVYGPDN